MRTFYYPPSHPDGLATALEYAPHFAVHDMSEPCLCGMIGILISLLTSHDDYTEQDPTASRYAWRPKDRHVLAMTMACRLAQEADLAQGCEWAVITWAVILRDAEITSTYLKMCQETVSITVISVGGNPIYGPTLVLCRDRVKDLKAAIKDKAIQEETPIARSPFKLLIASCSKSTSDDSMPNELSDDDTLFRFAPGDITLTLVAGT